MAMKGLLTEKRLMPSSLFVKKLRSAIEPDLRIWHSAFRFNYTDDIGFEKFIMQCSNPRKWNQETRRSKWRQGLVYDFVRRNIGDVNDEIKIDTQDIKNPEIRISVDGAEFKIQNHPWALAHVYRHASRAL
jgi:hypothetical protein